MSDWTGLVSRARGLSTHLLRGHALDAVAACGTIKDLALRLSDFEYLPAGIDLPRDAAEVELACRRGAADRVAILDRWTAGRSQALYPFTLAEDLRSIRALLRGAIAHVEPSARLRGLIPTAALPLRALERLASLDDLPVIGALLSAWLHPLAGPVAEAGSQQRVDLWRIDHDLLVAWSAAARRAARSVGASSLRQFVEQTIDLVNAVSARLLADQLLESGADDVFVDGGRLITRQDFAGAAADHDVLTLAERLEGQRDAAAIHVILTTASLDLEGELLRARIDQETGHVRRNPLDLAVVTLFFLRLRAEQRAIIGAAWACELESADTRGTS